MQCPIAHLPDMGEDCLPEEEGGCPYLQNCLESAEWHKWDEARRAAEEDRKLNPEKYDPF